MAKTKIKVGLAGTPKIAFDIFSEILSSKDISTEFVLTQPDKSSGRGLVTSKSLFANIDNVPMLQPESLSGEELIKKIEAFNIDLLVVVAYGKIRPSWLLNTPKFGCLNIHSSKLKKYFRPFFKGQKLTHYFPSSISPINLPFIFGYFVR